MEISQIEELDWPRPGKLRRLAKGRTLDSNELLALKSRSFFLPTWLLELLRANDETNKREIVTHLYNVLRYLDTWEDANPKVITVERRVKGIDSFAYIINQIARRDPAASIKDLKAQLRELSDDLSPGAMDEDERVFVKHFGRGQVLEDIRAQATGPVKEAILACTTSMALGMSRFLESESGIKTMDGLEEYCSYVAGDVGVALNRITNHLDEVKLGDERAKKFGKSLQIANITKNAYEDETKRGVVYLPTELFEGIDKRELFDMSSKRGKTVRASVLEKMLKKARTDLSISADYISTIPESLRGYRGFTLIPFFAAVETLKTMEEAGAEEVFRGNPRATKMDPEAFKRLGAFTYSLLKSEDGRKMQDFLARYQAVQQNGDRTKYCFGKGKFEVWARDE